MSVTRARRINGLFVEALEKAAPEREAFVSGLSPETRSEVEALLRAEETMGNFLGVSAVERFAPRELAAGERVGDYTIVRRLGAGGTGIVYEALQARPRRKVALKLLRLPLERLPEEAEILARLKHPGIAHVYEAGVHERFPFFAMEYVEGARTLVEHARGLDPGQRLELVAGVCDAVHHGHQKGIIHRDLKPANVLVDETGQPKVIDFGIARSTNEAMRGIEGTPPYMAPEQFQEHADVRSDVYALGVLLHEVLTGRLPFDVGSLPITEAERLVRETELPPPGRAWRGDVEAILRKALAKDPEERYASAAELAADLRRHLGHWPVDARRPTLGYQLDAFARRQRTAFLSLAGIVAVSVTAAVIGVNLSIAKERERRSAHFQAYAANVAAASAALRASDVTEARRRLAQAPPELRHWEWSYLANRLDASARTLELGKLDSAAFDHGLERVVTQRRDVLRIVDVETGAEIAGRGPGELYRMRPLFSPDGRWIACGQQDRRALILDAGTLETHVTLGAHEGAVWFVSFDREGRTLATAAQWGRVRVWSVPSGEPLAELGEADVQVRAVAVGGGLVALSTVHGTVELWDPTTKERVHVLEGHDLPALVLAFSPDGTRLVSAATDGTALQWDTETGERLFALERGREPISSVAFSADGERIVFGYDDGGVTIWDARDGTELATLLGHGASVVAVGFRDGGASLVSTSSDGSLKHWDTDASPGAVTLGQYTDVARDVAVSPDGRWLASACFDTTVRVHDLETGEEESVLEGHTQRVQSVCFDPLGRWLASGSADGTARIWDLSTRESAIRIEEPGHHVLDVAFSPDGELLATATGTVPPAPQTGAAVLWEASTGRRVLELPQPGWVWTLGFSPDGGRLAIPLVDAGKRTRSLAVWDVASGVLVWRVEEPAGELDRLNPLAVYDPTGETLLSATASGDLVRYDGETGRRLVSYPGLEGPVSAAAFSPDGRRIAGAMGRTIRLWDVGGAPILDLRGHTTDVQGLAWSPDGSQIVSSGGSWHGKDCTVRLWGRTPGRDWPPRLP